MTSGGMLHDVISTTGTYAFLRELEARRSDTLFRSDDLALMLRNHGIEDGPWAVEELVAANLLTRRGEDLGISTSGIRAALLLEALNDGNIAEVFDRLAHYDSNLQRYSLIREGMTDHFLQSLVSRPGFRRLYICSPWINLAGKPLATLMSAILNEEKRGAEPELLVITRPVQGTATSAPAAVEPLRTLGASIFLHARLHTKLYIREPGPSGGDVLAIVGSQNLTQSRYLELGIRVNGDSRVIGELIRYFMDLTTRCVEG